MARLGPIALALVWLVSACDETPTGPVTATSAPPAANATASAAPVPSASASMDLDACTEVDGVAVHISPRSPAPGVPLRVIAVFDGPTPRADVSLTHGAEALPVERAEGFGPPRWQSLTLAKAELGTYAVKVPTDRGTACVDVAVKAESASRPKASWAAVWPYERSWDARYEGLYSAWLEHLFDAPLTEQPVWSALFEVLQDPKRNLLYGHLGLREDDPEVAPKIEPDCADLPYTLRAYFAYKLGLPFGYSSCTRGSSRAAPTCTRWRSSLKGNDGSQSSVRRIGNYLRVKLANGVHSGTVRVRGDDDRGDYYPVKLEDPSLRPGTVYADPYGHILVLVKRVPQTKTSGGVLLAVDGQPDGTVSRRRFWRGNFLFDDDPVFGGPGFKRFRPIIVGDGKPRALGNAEIAALPGYGDYGLDQYSRGVDGFYERVDSILSPSPRDPEQAFLETITALDEQVRRRVVSVDNAIAHKKKSPGLIEMPDGAEIFETTGDWEDYSTPSRDMRLLIAIDVVRRFPAKVSANPQRWAAHDGEPEAPATLKARLEKRLAAEAKKRTFRYTRSDGSAFTLSLSDVLARLADFEMAYNPNDCPERRWAAPDVSEEAKTCAFRAPAGQRRRMEGYRSWFAKRQRPPRP